MKTKDRPFMLSDYFITLGIISILTSIAKYSPDTRIQCIFAFIAGVVCLVDGWKMGKEPKVKKED